MPDAVSVMCMQHPWLGLLVSSGNRDKGTALDWTEEEISGPSQCDGDKGHRILTHPRTNPTARGVCILWN